MFIRLLILFSFAFASSSFADDLKFVVAAPTPARPVNKVQPHALKKPVKKIEKPPATVTGFDGSKVVFGYPRFDGGVFINPGIYSLTQTLDSLGTKFNFSNLNLLDFNASARAFFTPHLVATIDARIEHVGTDATDLVSYQLQESSVTAISVNTALNYCFYLGNAEKKLCPGITFGYDNYPILKFTSNTDLSLTKLGDMGIGPNVLFIMPITEHLTTHVKAGYSLGLKQGQMAGFTMTSDHNLFVSGDLVCPVSKRMSLSFGVGVFSQSAVFTSLQDQGTWTMSNLNYTGNFGMRYNFNFSN
jgi:hypothetical protein